jgi:hypothetical protein
VPEVPYDSGIFVRRVFAKWRSELKGRALFRERNLRRSIAGLRPSHDRYDEVLHGPLAIGWFDTFLHRFHRRPPKAAKHLSESVTHVPGRT